MKSGLSLTTVFAAALQSAMVLTVASAAESQKVDNQLLESLNSELLEGLETLPAEEPDDVKPAEPSSGEGEDAATPGDDAFARIAKRMHEAQRLLAKLESQKNAMRVQREIVTDLDKLIAELEQQCKKCQGGESRKPSSQQTAQRESPKQSSPSQKPGQQSADQPARGSTDKLGKDKVSKVDLEQLKITMKDLWGQLPEKAREQMLQSSPEQFLPKYELLIEQYYKRLAEEKE